MTIGSLSCTLPGARPAGSLRGRLPHRRAQQRLPSLARPSAFRHGRNLPDGFCLFVKAPTEADPQAETGRAIDLDAAHRGGRARARR
jgi:hypothetical protein